ncbi:MAG TPA: phosphate-starvation-inducible PsiE family protein [Dissulfurispiraceae bacterium]|nr:phosphate-starvation-inducible PsiE family protein [Dissulfurispiraceae bacterium]
MLEYLKRFERIITASLVVMMAIIVLLATIELGWLIIQDIISPPLFLLEIEELLDIFGLFLLVLIGIELLETIKAYQKDNVVHVEVVFIVAMIAIARKVIILDIKEIDAMKLIGIGVIVTALSVGYWFVKRALGSDVRQ